MAVTTADRGLHLDAGGAVPWDPTRALAGPVALNQQSGGHVLLGNGGGALAATPAKLASRVGGW